MCSYAMSLVLVAMMVLGFAMAVRQGAVPIDAIALCWALIYMPLTQLSANFLLFWLHLDWGLPLGRQVASLVAEILARLVLTPLMVYQHATFVLGILVGKAVNWTSPSRNPADGLSWRSATRVFWGPTLIAAVWIPLAFKLAPTFLLFSGTILMPWLFSIPLAVLSSDMRFGAWLARTGIFASKYSAEELRELGSLLGDRSVAGRYRVASRFGWIWADSVQGTSPVRKRP
jgi:membrane glycosyltransferase